MAFSFSANQFENAFSARRLCNWEVPKWYPPRPRQHKSATKIIANDRGHLLPCTKRAKSDTPWGHYLGTYQLPRRITREKANEINNKLIGKDRWKQFKQKPPVCDQKYVVSPDKPLDLTYVPGDFTPHKEQHVSRDLLLQQKYERDNNIEPTLELNDLYLEKPETKPPYPFKKDRSCSVLPIVNDTTEFEVKDFENMRLSCGNEVVTGKPHERSPSPIIPAYENFQLAKRMHQENLDHQPLPDSVADQAYRRLQAEGGQFPGLGINMDPVATGIGIKTYNAGPTHCTKMKVFRPKTCGVVPKAYNDQMSSYRPFSSADLGKKMTSMDLAIGWDYRPDNPADEPRLPRHIDGSDDSNGPAVFNYVKSPVPPEKIDTGRSAGVFTNTCGEPDFFDKDIMQRKTDFSEALQSGPRKCSCATSPIGSANFRNFRAKSVSREGSCLNEAIDSKLCRSSPNLTQCHLTDYPKENDKPQYTYQKFKRNNDGPQPSFFRKTARLCHKVAPEPCLEDKIKSNYKAAFRAGVPKLNAAGRIASYDSGCSIGSGGCCSMRHKVIEIPRPRNPYSKKNYDIGTLVPPFSCFKGGAGQGGYPEHWRLSSVYQHAYKPIAQRTRPLLHTVYK